MTQYVQEKVEKLETPVTSWVLLGLIVAMSFAYACFINATIANIVATKDMQSKVSVLTTSVSSLESTYMAAKASVTADYALAQGFSQPKSDIIYISRANVGSLSFNR
jgi:hypothetical protein